MEVETAKKLLTVLANGINPITGEVLPETDSCNQVEIVRALYTVTEEIDKNIRGLGRPKPENTGKRWTDAEDEELVKEHRGGAKISELARIHKRTRNSITARLIRLGEIDDRLAFFKRKA